MKACDGGPVIFSQERVTVDGRRFRVYKFRSMIVNAEKDGVAVLASQHDSRITPVGKVISAPRGWMSCPQLYNILRGDMSLVGPRPERPEIMKKYEESIPEFSLPAEGQGRSDRLCPRFMESTIRRPMIS